MEYYFDLPVSDDDIKKLHIGDIIYVSGDIFTARDAAHKMMLENPNIIPVDVSDMALYHCGPLMNKKNKEWSVVSAGPTTSSRMEIFENDFIKKFKINLIIGKGYMGKDTQKALQKYICIYATYTGGAGALAADRIKKVKDVYLLDKLGMAEAIWVFNVENFGPLVISMDSYGKTLFKR